MKSKFIIVISALLLLMACIPALAQEEDNGEYLSHYGIPGGSTLIFEIKIGIA